MWSDVEPPATVCAIADFEIGLFDVNAWRISTRLSKSITCAMSFRLETLHEIRRRNLQRRQVLLHACAAVEQERQRDRLVAAVEEGDLLLHTVFEHGEFAGLEVGHVMVQPSVTVTLNDTTSTPALKDGPGVGFCGRALRERRAASTSQTSNTIVERAERATTTGQDAIVPPLAW